MVSSFLTQVLLTVASYLGVFILTIFAINWILGGLFKPYMKVRGSRGKLVLVKVKNILGDYYIPGRVEERFLIFKDRKKEPRRIALPERVSGIYRAMGVSCIDVDDDKNAIIIYSNELVAGFDAVKYSDLYTRALYKPSLTDNKTMIIIVLLIVILLGIFGLIALTMKNGKAIESLAEITTTTISTLPL
jgi:hypothetical protein